MMTIYESMAHALVNEQGRGLFINKTSSEFVYGFRTRFWRWLLVAYGERLYDLPKQMGLPPVGNAERKLPYNFPAYTLLNGMRCGIAATELMTYPTVCDYNHQYTPLHVGTALLKHGREEDVDEASMLLSASFLKSVYKNRSANDFAGHAYVNPWAPEDLGRQPFDIELLQTGDELHIVDELGNAAWFPVEYLEKVLRKSAPAYWYSKLCQLNIVHGRWTPQVQQAAAALLRERVRGKQHDEYRNSTNYVRNAPRGVIEAYFRTLHGIRETLCVVRKDATAEEMSRGLKPLALTNSERSQEMYRYIGRELTIEDFERLTPKQALTILYYAPYKVVERVIKEHPIELGAMFFTLTDKKTLPMVTNSMSEHGSREKIWVPDTDNGNLTHLLSTTSVTKESLAETWTKVMLPLVNEYTKAKPWRDALIQLAPPEVLLLALCRWAGAEEQDPIPGVAFDNVLRSYPDILQVRGLIALMPPEMLKLASL